MLEDCPGLLSVGFRCRREGYTFEWPAYSDSPKLRTPEGTEVKLVNIMDVPYYMEEIKETDAPPAYHEHVKQMLDMAGRSAVAEEQEPAACVECEEPLYPLAATVKSFLAQAGPNVPDVLRSGVASDARAAADYPAEVNELLATHEPIQVLVVETDSAKRFQLPPKDSHVSWDMLTHRLSMDRNSNEVLETMFVWLGQPEDGERTRYLNKWKFPVDIVTYFLWSPDLLDKDEMQERSAQIPPRADAPPENAVHSRENHEGGADVSGDDADAAIRSGGSSRALAAEAKSVKHMFCHEFLNPHCQACNESKLRRAKKVQKRPGRGGQNKAGEVWRTSDS